MQEVHMRFSYYLKRMFKWKPKATTAWHFFVAGFGAFIFKMICC